MTLHAETIAIGRAPEPAPSSMFPDEVLTHTALLIREFMLEWHREIPSEIHTGSLDIGGFPAFHPDFIAYVDRPCKRQECHDSNCSHGSRSLHPDSRVRVSRAFRRLRGEAPREWDALYLVCRHGLTLAEVAKQMTDRAVRIGRSNRYTEVGVLVLVISAAHKIEMWW